jgi:hypothetical protein
VRDGWSTGNGVSNEPPLAVTAFCDSRTADMTKTIMEGTARAARFATDVRAAQEAHVHGGVGASEWKPRTDGQPGAHLRCTRCWTPGAGQVAECGLNTVRSHLATPRKENGIIGKDEGFFNYCDSASEGGNGRGGLRHVGSWS